MNGPPALGLALAAPQWLWLLAALPAVVWWRRRRAAALALGAQGLAAGALAQRLALPPLPRSRRQRLHGLPLLLQLAALALGAVALARPQWREPLPAERLGRDLMLCLDTSSSMAAEDLAPGQSRLAVAKELAAAFAAERRDDRLGAVAFARYADLVCPPTQDHQALGELLAAVRLVGEESPEDATGIGTAVARAAQVLRQSPRRGRVVVLLTDGAENVASAVAPREIAPLHAAQLCRELGIRVHAVAVGRGDPLPGGGHAPLDTGAIEQLAAWTGGRFFRAADRGELAAVYAAIDAVEPSAIAPPGVRVHERFAGWLLLAVALWLLGRGLGARGLEVAP